MARTPRVENRFFQMRFVIFFVFPYVAAFSSSSALNISEWDVSISIKISAINLLCVLKTQRTVATKRNSKSEKSERKKIRN